MQQKNAAIRKRTQIALANRVMFLWVAGVSVIFGFASVATIFLVQMTMFNERVIAEKNKTISVLKANNLNIEEIESQVRTLDANQALIDAKANTDDQAIQVILDALPSDANSLALGASIQKKLLAGIDGLELNSLQVDPVVGVESLTGDTSVVNASSSSSVDNEITFRFSVKGSEENLKKVLVNLEKSIRAIDIISLKIEGQGDASIMSIQARAFYEPVKIVELKEKVVK